MRCQPNSPPSGNVPKKRGVQFHVAGPARVDIAAILRRTLQEFGHAAKERYRALIGQALLDIEADPGRPGSKEKPEIMIQGARVYHLDFSRTRVTGTKVKEPRHLVLYRRREDG